MKRKIYIKPDCEVYLMEVSEFISMSLHDEDAPFVGANRRQPFFDDFSESGLESAEGVETDF